MLWIETTTDSEARSLNEATWRTVETQEPDGTVVGRIVGPSENGEFWTVALDRAKDDPRQRFEISRRHLPLPAAWREMSVALRAMIRRARKEKLGYDEQLRELHRLAAISSFADYGIIERIPFARLASLELSYDRVGCDALLLLNKTDGKWMREAWGEPTAHTTARDLYLGLFESERKRVLDEDAAAAEARSQRLFDELLQDEQPRNEIQSKASGRQGFFAKLLRW